ITDTLRAQGYDAYNLIGGMCAWTAAGLPVITDGAPTADPGDATAVAKSMVVHRSDPLNCETSIPDLIGGVVVPNARFYVRNHFQVPRLDPSSWRLNVVGLVECSLSRSLRD